jgi:alkanesulfonate monooxygenase SsuD/methylene tetrahydromethanopterin reductase-like flavin-dependent oxidoreductase (luciferase family)
MRRDLKVFEDSAREAGRDPPGLPFGQLQNTFVWNDGDAWEVAGRFVKNQLGIYRGWDEGGDTPTQGFRLSPPDDEAMRRLTPTGTPQEVIHALRPIVEAFAGRKEFHLVARLHYPGMDFDTASRSVELFAEKVIPALKGG